MRNDIKITTLHFEIHETFREELTQLLEKLFLHQEKITEIRATLEGLYPANNTISYCARLALATTGAEIFVSARQDHLLLAVTHAIEMAERKLSDRTHIREDLRRHPHAIDIGGDFPKVEVV